jgi:hypothetical protein
LIQWFGTQNGQSDGNPKGAWQCSSMSVQVVVSNNWCSRVTSLLDLSVWAFQDDA